MIQFKIENARWPLIVNRNAKYKVTVKRTLKIIAFGNLIETEENYPVDDSAEDDCSNESAAQ